MRLLSKTYKNNVGQPVGDDICDIGYFIGRDREHVLLELPWPARIFTEVDERKECELRVSAEENRVKREDDRDVDQEDLFLPRVFAPLLQ